MEIIDSAVTKISSDLAIAKRSVGQTIGLLEDGGTVPFIARYRKEVTGSLDELQIASIKDQLEKFKELEKRKEAILRSLEERNIVDEALCENIRKADNLTLLEDIYLPFSQGLVFLLLLINLWLFLWLFFY